jgi:hypothetical protein
MGIAGGGFRNAVTDMALQTARQLILQLPLCMIKIAED